MPGRVARFSVSVLPEILREFDETIKKLGYKRSSAIEEAMRDYLTQHKWTIEKQGAVAGAITMLYDHDVRGLEENLTDIQHQYRDIISSTTHVHLDDKNCLEIIAVKGEVEKIQSLAERLMTTRGVKQIKIATLIVR